MIYKNRDITFNIDAVYVNIGHIGAKFYTKDENTASITIYVKKNGVPLDLTQANLTPHLYLFLPNGNKLHLTSELTIIDPTQGKVLYELKTLTKEIGLIKGKFLLKSSNESVHVVDFEFSVEDSYKV